MKIAYQGVAGSYSESCAKEKYPDCETIPCKTFDECFEKANNDSLVKAIIPESNKTTGNIGVEYLIFKYNEHNIEKAKQMAKEVDVTFMLLQSSRWNSEDDPLRPSKKYDMSLK